LKILLLDPLTTIKSITELFVKVVIISHRNLLSHSSTVHKYESPFQGSDQESFCSCQVVLRRQLSFAIMRTYQRGKWNWQWKSGSIP